MTTLKVHYCNPRFADAVARHGLDDAETVFNWRSGEWVGARLYGSLVRDTIDGIGPVYIKRYDYDRPILQYRLIGSRAYREWVNSQRLARLGVAQPETIIAATRMNARGVTGSYLMTCEVPDSISLEQWLDDAERPPDGPALERLADGLLATIHRMHGGGLCHWDLKARNILVARPHNGMVLMPIDAVNGRRIRRWNRWHCVHRDYRFLLRHPRLGPVLAARRELPRPAGQDGQPGGTVTPSMS